MSAIELQSHRCLMKEEKNAVVVCNDGHEYLYEVLCGTHGVHDVYGVRCPAYFVSKISLTINTCGAPTTQITTLF